MPHSAKKPDPEHAEARETASPLLWIMLLFLLVSPLLLRLLPQRLSQDLRNYIEVLFR